MAARQGAVGKRYAFTTTWRNLQTKKNKTWDNDGYLFIDGQAASFMDADGKLLCSKTIGRPVKEEDEITHAGRDFLIVDTLSLSDYYIAIEKEHDYGTPARGTPAARPGFLTRPGAPVQTPQPLSRTSASASASTSATTPAQAATPLSTGKRWAMGTSSKAVKPFKAVIPGTAIKRSESMEPSRGVGTPVPVPSGLGREVQVAPAPRLSLKGKERAKEEEVDDEEVDELEDDDDASVENALPSSQHAEEPPSKKRRLELPPRTSSAVTASASTSTAAQPPPRRTSSANPSSTAAAAPSRRMPWDDIDDSLARAARPTKEKPPPLQPPVPAPKPSSAAKPASAKQPLFNAPSPVKAVVKAEELDDEDVLAQLELEMEMEVDAELFANDDDQLEAELAAGFGDDSGCYTAGTNSEDERAAREVTVEMGKKGKGKASEASVRATKEASVEVVVKDEEMEDDPVALAKRSTKRYFEISWRKYSATKKSPVFRHDGILLVDAKKAELFNAENGKRVCFGFLAEGAFLERDDIFKIGYAHEVELGSELETKPSYPYTPSNSSFVEPPAPAPPPKPSTKPAAPAMSAFKAFRPPGSAKSVNPLASTVEARKSASPAPVPPPARNIKAASFFMPHVVPVNKIVPLSQGGKGVVRKPVPKFDPEAKGAVVMKRPDAEHEKTYNSKKKLPVVDVVIDPILGDKLRDHQKEGVKFLYECVMGMRTAGQGCILADDMGLGKTIQAIALIWTLLKQNPYFGDSVGVIQRAMIVCPVTLVKNWSSEIKKWLGRDRLNVFIADGNKDVSTFARNKRYDILIIGYERLRTSIEEIKYAQPPVGLVICDEGHRLKSSNAKTTQAIQTLSCMRRVILSGTPIQNNLGEFFAMMDFVNPGLFESANYFKKHFEGPIMASRQPNASVKVKNAGAEASETLATIQHNFVLRRTNEVNLKHLPTRLDYSVFIVPTKLEVALYRNVLSGSTVRALLEGHGKKEQLSLLTTLRKLVNTPGLLLQEAQSEKSCDAMGDEMLEMIPKNANPNDFGLSGKLSVLGSLLAELRSTSDEKIVVISNFTKTLDIVQHHCKSNKYPHCRLDGQTPQQDRIPMVEGFNKGSTKNNFVFLLSSKAGGTGLNIIGASRLIMLDADWNPSTDAQAMARIHREGQQRVCVIYRFFTAGTIDEKIFQRQITKQGLSSSIMGEEVAGSTKSSNAFSPEELRAIFTIHDDSSCETHDLMGCRCHFGEVMEDGDDEDDEAEESDEEGGFQQASQWEEDSEQKARKNRRNLSVLKTWTHYNCSDANSIDAVEDQLLQSIVYHRMSAAAEDEHRLDPSGHGELYVRGGQVGWVFGKKTG